jgi:hypothetical protein
MGISGGVFLPGSAYYDEAANTGLAAQAQANVQSLVQSNQAMSVPWDLQTWQPASVAPTLSMSAGELKLRIQITKLIEVLPVSICSRIMRVDFFPAFQDARRRFVVVFDTQKELIFEDVDAFPSDEQIAQIALVCP